jgi:hypothetical protein
MDALAPEQYQTGSTGSTTSTDAVSSAFPMLKTTLLMSAYTDLYILLEIEAVNMPEFLNFSYASLHWIQRNTNRNAPKRSDHFPL